MPPVLPSTFPPQRVSALSPRAIPLAGAAEGSHCRLTFCKARKHLLAQLRPNQHLADCYFNLPFNFISHKQLQASCNFPGAPNTQSHLLPAPSIKKEPKYTTISSNLAQVSHIFVLMFFPGEDLKAIAFPGD